MSFMTPGTLPSGVVFTRASTATYFGSTGTMQTAATDAPRWDYDPVTLGLKGMLIEEARTNLCLQSTVGPAPWGAFSTNVVNPVATPNTAMAPDGTTSATGIVLPAVSGAGSVAAWFQSLVFSAASIFSVYLKGAVGGEQLYVCANGPGNVYVNGGRITLTTQWQRFSCSMPANAAGWAVVIGTDLRDTGQTASPACSVYAWGAQIEQGAFPTSYIPTTAATVTRAADAATMTTGVWFNAAASSLMAEYMMPLSVLNTAPNNKTAWSISDGTTANRLALFAVASGAVTTLSGAGIAGVVTNVSAVGNVVGGVTTKFAASWDGTTNANALNGTTGGSAGVGMPSGLATVVFGTNGLTTNNNVLNGWLRRTQYWPRALSTAELQAVTR